MILKSQKLILTNNSGTVHTRKTRQNDQYTLDKNERI